jgi:hypothetical protein
METWNEITVLFVDLIKDAWVGGVACYLIQLLFLVFEKGLTKAIAYILLRFNYDGSSLVHRMPT